MNVGEKVSPKERVKTRGFPLRDLTLTGLDIEMVPDYAWRGNLENPALMVVTDAPTSFELKAGIGFISDPARFLDMVLDDAGLATGDFLANFDAIDRTKKRLPLADLVAGVRASSDPGEVFFYNLNIDPHFDSAGKLLAPTEAESFVNAALFHELVLALKPKHILLLGNEVTIPLLGKGNILDTAGATLDYTFPAILVQARNQGNTDPWMEAHIAQELPRIVVSTDLKPGALFHNEEHLPGWQARLARLVTSLGQKVEVMPKCTVILAKYEHALNGLTQWLAEPLEVLCYDWETTSLNPCVHQDSIIVSLGLARDTKEGICIPIGHPHIHWEPDQRATIFKLIRLLLLKQRAGTLGHNILFDNLVTRCDRLLEFPAGRRLPGLRLETMYLAYVHNENSARGLKELCNTYTDMHGYDQELEAFKKISKPEDYSQIDLDILGHYNANDCIATFRLFEYLSAELANDERGPFIDIALRLMAVEGQALEDMAYNGQMIDRAILFSEGRKHEERLRQAVAKLMAAPEMQSFIAVKRQRVAAKWAGARLRQPINSQRDYRALINPAPDTKELRKRIKSWTDDLKFNRADLWEEDGIIRLKDGTLHPETELIRSLFEANKDYRFAYLDPSRDELERWKPWLHDEEYQADEEEERYYSEHAGHGYKPNFNTSGNGEMGEFFFEHLKFPVNFRSEKTNKPSLAKEARPQLIGLHPILTDFFAYKDVVKEYGTYFKPVIKGFRLHDNHLDSEEIDWRGRSHLEITIGKVVTGRTSAQRIQTFPRKGTVKNMYVSRFDDEPQGLIVQGDMSQAELRVVASLAHERKMIEAYAKGEDLHKTTSILLFGEAFTECTDPKLKKEYRAVAKRFNFAVIYGSGAPGLVLTCKKEGVELLSVAGYDLNEVYEVAAQGLRLLRSDPYAYARIEAEVDSLRVEIAEDILKRFFEAYPDLADWISGVHAFLAEHGYYYSPFGRLRRLPGIYSPDPGEVAAARREAQNFPVQSAASDIAVVALAAMQTEIEARHLGAVSIAAVHDSTIFDSPFQEAVVTAEIMQRRLCSAKENFAELLPEFDMSWLKVPLESEIEIGPSWGISYPYRDGKLLVESTENGDPQDLEIEVSEFWDYYAQVKAAA